MVKVKVVIILEGYESRELIKNLINDEKIEIVGEAENSDRGIEIIRQKRPDIILLGSDLPDRPSLIVCSNIQQMFPKAKIILLFDKLHIPTIYRFTGSSAFGFVTDHFSKMQEVIKIVFEGSKYIQPDIAPYLVDYAKKINDKLKILKPKEYEVLTLIAKEKTYEQISEYCKTSLKNVYSLKYKGFKKLGLNAKNLEKLQQVILGKLE